MTRQALTNPSGTVELLVQKVDEAVKHFPSNTLCKRLDGGKLTIQDYHSALRTLFHQVYFSSSSFALAAAHCPPELTHVRNYLIRHADEEKDHWLWILSDLEKTGYKGPDVKTLFPTAAAQAYIAFNYYIATWKPLSRLAIALMLESVGANFGKRYGNALLMALRLTKEQTQFFFGHGDTDVGHTQALWEIIRSCELSPQELGWMCHSAEVAGRLYFQMYEEAGK